MKFEVELHMFKNGEIRVVDVPDKELTGDPEKDLDKVWVYGQNDNQPSATQISVSAGDIVRYNGSRYMINLSGYRKLSNGGALVSDPVKKVLQLYGKDYNKP